MFVYTLKWNRKTALLAVIAAALIICVVIIAVGSGDSGPTCKAKTNEDRVDFLESLGWQVDSEPLEEREIIIPREFSDIYQAYNELQLAQGYDLSQYCGMEATVYTYQVLNYTGYDGNVVAELYIVNYKVVGGDIHSLELDGFMHGLTSS